MFFLVLCLIQELIKTSSHPTQLFLPLSSPCSVTPFAVLSLIATAIGSQDDLAGAFSNVAYLILANLVGYMAHFLITDVGIHWLLTRKNPFAYLKFIVPAQTTALACASSAATLPVTLRCVKASGQVPDDVSVFNVGHCD